MDGVNKTLYIPLYGKAFVSRQGLFLRDESAEAIWKTAGFSLKGKAKSKWLAYNMGMRSAVFDRWTEEKLARFPDAAVLHLGCGLDGRVGRVKHRGQGWFDVDFPEVIEERRKYFPETEEYRMVAGDLRMADWLEAIPAGGTAIVIMEGVSMYLRPEENRTLLNRLKARFDRVCLLLDVYTIFGAKASRYKNPINTVGVTQVYGVDSPGELTEGTGFRFVRQHSLTPEEYIAQLPAGEQGFFRVMFGGKAAGKIYRLYELEA